MASLRPAPLARRHAAPTLEDAVEVGNASEPDVESNVGDGPVSFAEQTTGFADSQFLDVARV